MSLNSGIRGSKLFALSGKTVQTKMDINKAYFMTSLYLFVDTSIAKVGDRIQWYKIPSEPDA